MQSTRTELTGILPPGRTIVLLSVNPHPAPDEQRLSQITDETLRTLIELRRGAAVADSRLDAAGIPSLNVLTTELLRRERTELAVTR